MSLSAINRERSLLVEFVSRKFLLFRGTGRKLGEKARKITLIKRTDTS